MSVISRFTADKTVTEVRVCQSVPPTVPTASYYDGFGGGLIVNVPPNTQTPTAFELATNGIRLPVANFNNRADNYSARLRGFIRPTISGNYTFSLSSDDAAQFSLGLAGAALGATTALLNTAAFTGAPGTGGATSAAVAMVAGQYYPFETIFSEGGGGDYVQVDWAGPVGARQVVPAVVIFSATANTTRAVYRTTTTLGGVSTATYALLDGTPVIPTVTSPIVDCP